MNAIHETGLSLFTSILQTTWQASILALLILTALALLGKRLSPAWRYGLWTLVIVRLLLPISPPTAWSIFNVAQLPSPPADFVALSTQDLDAIQRQNIGRESPEKLDTEWVTEFDPQAAAAIPVEIDSRAGIRLSESELPAPAVESAPLPPGRAFNWFEYAFLAWLLGATALLIRLLWGLFRFNSRLRSHVTVSNETVLRVFEECRAALHVTQPVVLIETEEVETPGVHGLWKKRLLLPDGALEQFSLDELRHVFLHELAHVKRRDLEVNWLAVLLQTLHWFNPILWFAFARLRAEREQAADALAMSRVHDTDTVAYGETLLKVLTALNHRSAFPGLVGIGESKESLKQRLQAITRFKSSKPWRWLAITLLAVTAAISLTDAVNSQQTAPETGEPIPENFQRLELQTILHETGESLAGVQVQFEFRSYSGVQRSETHVSDASGKVVVVFDPSDLQFLGYHSSKPGLMGLWGEWEKQQIAFAQGLWKTPLSPGTEIGGIIADQNGNPVQGAEVFVDTSVRMIMNSALNNMERSRMEKSLQWRLHPGELLATSSADGRWKARCMWPERRLVHLRIRHPGFADSVYSTRVTAAMEAEGNGRALKFEELTAQTARLILAPGLTVRGRVLTEAGRPVQGIPVYYATRRSENPYWDTRMGNGTVSTDAQGGFAIPNLPREVIHFGVQALDLPAGDVVRHFAPAVTQMDLRISPPETELRLQEGRSFTGLVRDHRGLPVSGATVTFRDWSIWQGIDWHTVTDETGTFRWSNAPTERFRVSIQKPGYPDQQATIGADATQEFSFFPALHLTGNVVDAVTTKPVSKFQIVWADGEGSFDQRRLYAISGSGGTYSLDLDEIHEDYWADGYAHQFVFRIEAEGYQPFTSRQFSSREGDAGDARHDVELTPARILSGHTFTPDGNPAIAAQVALKSPSIRLRIDGTPRFTDLDKVAFPVTDDTGSFRITDDPAASHLVIVHESGIAMIEREGMSSEMTVRLQPWGWVTGTVWRYDSTVPNAGVSLSSYALMTGTDGGIQFCHMLTDSDEGGNFRFDFVPPGNFSLGRRVDRGGLNYGGFKVEPGQTLSLKLGGTGRPIVGRFVIRNPYIPIDWQRETHSIRSALPKPPEGLQTPEEYQAWRQQEQVQRAYDHIRYYPIRFAGDGSFRIDEVIPGSYNFNLEILDPRDRNALASGRYIARFSDGFEVPATDNPNTREPLDAGTFEISLGPQFPGESQKAFEFTAPDLSGNEIRLSDFTGKYVLLDFWATWCAPCIGDLPFLRAVYETYKDRDDFVMVSLNLDKTLDRFSEFVPKNNMPWKHGFLGDWSQTEVPGRYGVQGMPALFLIAPNGEVLESNLRGPGLAHTLQKWLRNP